MVDDKEVSHYLAIDPGHTIGWASFNEVGTILDFDQFPMGEFAGHMDSLLHKDLKLVIVEDYRNHGWMNQPKWSRNETSKIIGKIEMLAEIRGVPIVLQSNTNKSIGYMYAGIPEPTNHSISHKYDAYAHGVYYLQVNGIRPVGKALLENRKKDDKRD